MDRPFPHRDGVKPQSAGVRTLAPTADRRPVAADDRDVAAAAARAAVPPVAVLERPIGLANKKQPNPEAPIKIG